MVISRSQNWVSNLAFGGTWTVFSGKSVPHLAKGPSVGSLVFLKCDSLMLTVSPAASRRLRFFNKINLWSARCASRWFPLSVVWVLCFSFCHELFSSLLRVHLRCTDMLVDSHILRWSHFGLGFGSRFHCWRLCTHVSRLVFYNN